MAKVPLEPLCPNRNLQVDRVDVEEHEAGGGVFLQYNPNLASFLSPLAWKEEKTPQTLRHPRAQQASQQQVDSPSFLIPTVKKMELPHPGGVVRSSVFRLVGFAVPIRHVSGDDPEKLQRGEEEPELGPLSPMNSLPQEKEVSSGLCRRCKALL